jgi:hypothetical protein
MIDRMQWGTNLSDYLTWFSWELFGGKEGLYEERRKGENRGRRDRGNNVWIL